MSTTRHLVNRRRRLATVAATAAPPRTTATPRPAPEPLTEAGDETEASTGTEPGTEPEPEGEPAHDDPPRRRLPRLRIRLPAVLCAATLLLGAFAAWSFTSAGALRDEPSRQNTALTDIGRTSEVKGQITQAVGAVFSYDYASPGKSDLAARKHLTGKAVQQHKDMLAEVRAQAPKQKLVLTTAVTESGVEFLDGDRARLLVFADQSNTRTGKEEETTYAAAMFAVDAVRRGDTWRIAAIDTFTR
ncbi:procyclic acidic repetitive family protein [Streptomyces sp. NBC_01693]|uniref:hypothetical protein n=1 Tax=unclassified Streptomyces TaxID=2593676 RepID=UPI000F557C61|nr:MULTISPECIES: hypothetical protein [unclassified Streptomyces]MDX3427519.1 hypothetical protein [Streptomyces sp. ME01-18a]MDX3684379.1 hypothetical protein [Streptomyces sp. AK04-4c]RPK45372.1 hypothetical protein EES40_13145 [Streptomyces sp. ADI93-02]WSS72532.1 procyclic acidic repetitive family protein [Streptomyces sp. NBC_01175]